MVKYRQGSLVVLDKGEMVGIVTERDVLEKIPLRAGEVRSTVVEKIMTPSSAMVTAPPSFTLDKCVKQMRSGASAPALFSPLSPRTYPFARAPLHMSETAGPARFDLPFPLHSSPQASLGTCPLSKRVKWRPSFRCGISRSSCRRRSPRSLCVPRLSPPASCLCLGRFLTYSSPSRVSLLRRADPPSVAEFMDTRGKGGAALKTKSCSVADAVEKMRDVHSGSLIVSDGGSGYGIFTERDYLSKVAVYDEFEPSAIQLSEVSTPGLLVKSVTTESRVTDCLSIMIAGGFRHLPVNDGGSIVGMVSMRDILNFFLTDPFTKK
jgi:CBS domain-containing protein